MEGYCGRQPGSASSVNSAPAAMREQISNAVAHDYAYGTRAVLYGMAIALAITFLVARFQPGGQAPDAETDTSAAADAPEASPRTA